MKSMFSVVYTASASKALAMSTACLSAVSDASACPSLSSAAAFMSMNMHTSLSVKAHFEGSFFSLFKCSTAQSAARALIFVSPAAR